MQSRKRSILTLTGLFLFMAHSVATTAATPKPGGVLGYEGGRPPGMAPVALTSSVIVRPIAGFAAASDDPVAYGADRYVVNFRGEVRDPLAVADELGERLAFRATHVFQRTVKGFAAKLSSEALAAVRADPRVVSVQADTIIPFAVVPTGVRRIGTQLNTTAKLDNIDGSGQRVNADVAVIDTGIDGEHPDLNVAGGTDCTGEDDPFFDDAGHGTHIAGTIGALDDGVGVVGVAPGARLWAIKVGDASGAFLSWYLCGLTVLADNAGLFEVANISLGTGGSDGSCSSTDEHQLICDAVANGVTIAVAAGNGSRNASTFVPATFSQVIAVSAIADTDGLIGSKGPNSHSGDDDTFAEFSNYGSDIDIAAPGVDILSTWPTNLNSGAGFGLGVLSGTSMAAPHVAGAAALYIAKNGRVGPTAVKNGLRANSDVKALLGDPDGIHEPVLYVGAIAPACTLSPTSAKVGGTITLSCTKFRANEVINVYLDSTSNDRLMGIVASNTGSGSKTFTVPTLVRGGHTVIGKGDTSGKQTTGRFSLVPSLALLPKYGPPGTSVRVSIRGFAKGETITVKWYSTASSSQTVLSGVIANSVGAQSVSFVAPEGTVGLHKVEAIGSRGNKTSVNFSLRAGSARVAEEPSVASSTATATTEGTAEADATRPPRATRTPRPTRTPVPEETSTTADLTVAIAGVQPGADVTTDDDLTVIVEVGNSGERSVDRSFVVCAYVDPAQAPEPGDREDARTRVRRDVPAGSALGVEIKLGELDAGTHAIWVVVDCGESVTESDETDNVAGPFELTIVKSRERVRSNNE